MFASIRVAALALAIPSLVSALQIQAPTNPTSDGRVTIKWTADATDPATFSLQLTNEIFHDTFAIANNVDINAGEITLMLPTLQPVDGYAIIGHDISNINNVFGRTGSFSVGPASTGTSSSTAASSGASGSGTATATTSRPPVQSLSTTGFGATVARPTSSAPAASAASNGASSAAAAGASANPFNAGSKIELGFGTLAAGVAVALAALAF